MSGEMRREKSLRNDVHHANAVVWGPVYRTRLGGDAEHADHREAAVLELRGLELEQRLGVRGRREA
jgi:hypothetical protein